MDSKIQEIINGNLLGDGGIGVWKNKYYYYKQTAKDIEFLEWLQDRIIEAADVKFNTYITNDNKNSGTFALGFYINATNDEYFLNLHNKWYEKRDNKNYKILPKDLDLSSTVLLHWYLGDGSLIRQGNNRVPRIVLATNCYTKRDVDFLIDKLKGLGLNFYASESVSGFNKGKKCGYVIISYTQDGTPYSFFRLIGLQCPSEIADCLTGFKGRGSKAHYFRGKWPSEEDWIAILSNVQGIGKTIRTKRKGLGLSTRELAELTGVKARHIRHIEHGDRYPSLSLLRKLLKVLNINAIYLLERLGDLGYGIRQNQTRGEEH